VTLRIKILAALTLVLSLTVGASFLVLIRYQRAQLLRNTSEATSHLANTIRATLEHAMLANDPAEIRRIVSTVGEQPGIAGVYILDSRGTVRVTSTPAERGRSLPEQSPDVLRSRSPIPNTPRCQGCHPPAQRLLGQLVVDRSLEAMEEQLRTSLGYMLASAGLAFLLLTVTTYAVLRRLVVIPLASLGRAARAIQAGEYDTPLTLPTSDEVGELARTLERMRGRIVEHLEEIRRWGAELERRVRERTEELTTLNRVALVTNEALDLTTIFTRALETTLDALGVSAGAIALTADGMEPPIVVARGLQPSEAAALAQQAGRVGVERACGRSDSEQGAGTFACFPIPSKGAAAGILCLHDSRQVPLAPEKLRLLEALAAQLGGTVERAVLHQDLERSLRELRDSQAAIVERERQIAALEAVRAATVTLSHHINNATAGIAGCRDVLASALGEETDWQLRYALDGIRASVKKISAVLQALRDLTQVNVTNFPGGIEAIDVDRAIQEKLARLQADAHVADTPAGPPAA